MYDIQYMWYVIHDKYYTIHYVYIWNTVYDKYCTIYYISYMYDNDVWYMLLDV